MKKELVIFIVCAAVSLLSAGQLVKWIGKNAIYSNRRINQRYREAIAAFDKYPPEKMVLVLGSSEIEAGFNPRAFAKHLQKYERPEIALNFGFRNIGPSGLEPLIDELEFQIESKNKAKINTIYFKINPGQLTKARAMTSRSTELEEFSNIHSHEYLISHPTVKNVLAFYIKFFQEGFLPSRIFDGIRSIVVQYFDCKFGTEFIYGSDAARHETKLWNAPMYNELPAWNFKTNGAHNWDDVEIMSQVANLMSLITTREGFRASLFLQNRRTDVTNLNFDQDLVLKLENQIRRMTDISDNVIVFYFPENPAIDRKPEVNEKLNQLISHACVIQSVQCLRLDQNDLFTTRDFYDVYHLNFVGSDRLSEYLANHFLKATQKKE